MIPPQLLAYSEQLSRFEHLRDLAYGSKFGLIEQIADSPVYRLGEYLQSTPAYRLYQDWQNTPAYQLSQHVQSLQAVGLAERDTEYLELLAKTIQWAIELGEEIEEKAKIVKPVLKEHRGFIQKEFGLLYDSAKKIAVELYLGFSVEDIRFRLPEDIAKDIIRLAAEQENDLKKAATLEREIIQIEQHSKQLTLNIHPTSNSPAMAPVGNQSHPQKKSVHKILTLFLLYAESYNGDNGKKVMSKQECRAFGEENNLNGDKFYQTYCKGKNGKVKVKELNEISFEELLFLLEGYPLARKQAESHRVNKR